MKQISLQFHAKKKEIINYIKNIVDQNNLKAFGVSIFPEYVAKEIFVSDKEEYENYSKIIVCKNRIKIDDMERYEEYLKLKKGDLIVMLGKDDEIELIESSMGVISDNNIDTFWKKVIDQFKKSLLMGAYVVTPTGSRKYYPKHRYTIGAKEAYKKGVIIRPIAGWNQYILQREDEE